MKCLSNVERATYPIELVMDLTKLYQFKGKDFYYEDFLKNHLDGIIRTTVEADTLAFCRILKLNVTENRSIIENRVHMRTSSPLTLYIHVTDARSSKNLLI